MTRKDIVRLAMEWSNGDPELCTDMIVTMDSLVQTEREACAQVCEARLETGAHLRCAADIRARSCV